MSEIWTNIGLGLIIFAGVFMLGVTAYVNQTIEVCPYEGVVISVDDIREIEHTPMTGAFWHSTYYMVVEVEGNMINTVTE